MKIGCECGETIHDTTNSLPDKAHFVSDEDWDRVWRAVDNAVAAIDLSETGKEIATAILEAFFHTYFRRLYQCSACGRIYIDDQTGEFWEFIPATGDTPRELLRRRPPS